MLIKPGTKPIKFYLNDDTKNYFLEKKVKWNIPGLSEFTFMRTYSRKKDNGKLENWNECVIRVIEGMFTILKTYTFLNHIPWNEDKAQRHAKEAAERMFCFKWLPPGRGLWMMGTDYVWERGSMCLNNCAFVSTARMGENVEETIKPFTFLMDVSMVGVGCGFDTEGADKVKVLGNTNYTQTFFVQDTRESWVEAIGKVIEHAIFGKPKIELDVSRVRPEGEPIRGFGGISSGPLPLLQAAYGIAEVINRKAGMYLSSTDIVDIQNLIGKCVVAGNVRRCLPKGTLVHLDKGLTSIEKVQVGDMVHTSKGLYKVSENVYQGKQYISVLQTNLGELHATDKHKIAVLNSVDSYVWKKLNELKVGDRIVAPLHNITGNITKLPDWKYEKPEHSTTCKDITIPLLDNDMAWFIGYFHGDGYVYPNFDNNGFNAYISVAVNENDILIKNKVIQQIRRFGIEPNIVEPKDNDKSFKIRGISKQLAWYFSKFKTAKETILVPEFILNGTEEIRAAYVSGVCDADGCLNNKPLRVVTTVYPTFAKQIQALLSSIGILSRYEECAEVKNKNWQSKFNVNIIGSYFRKVYIDKVLKYSMKNIKIDGDKRSQNDFNYPNEWNSEFYYGNKLLPYSVYNENGGKSHLVPVTIETIEHKAYEEETYDLSVPEVNEFIIEGGFLVHNTAEIAFSKLDDHNFINMKNFDYNKVETGVSPPEELKEVCREEYDFFFENQKSIVEKYKNEPWAYKFGGWRWASNNSLFAEVGMNYADYEQSIINSGEPGFAWLDNMRHYGRMKDEKNYKDIKVCGGNPCLEQSLESYEICNLVENFPVYHDSYWDFQRSLKFSYLYSKVVTLMGTHIDRTNAVIIRNRRIGCSLSGVADMIAKVGRGKFFREYCDNGYSYIQYLDTKYSDWLGIRESIKKTSCKPSGTVSLVAGVFGPGVHFTKMKSGYRTVRIANTSELVAMLKDAGYRVEPAVNDPMNTSVVYFPWLSPDNILSEEDTTIWEKFKMAVDMQYWWADNQVSCTIEFTKDEADRKEISRCLEAFDSGLKGISLLPKVDGLYAQMPYTRAPKDEILQYMSNLKELDFESLTVEGENASANLYCDGEKCVLAA